MGLHNLTKFSKSECQLPRRYEDIPKHGHCLGHEQIERSPEEEDLEVLVNENLNATL